MLGPFSFETMIARGSPQIEHEHLCQTIWKLIPTARKRVASSSPKPVTGVSMPPVPGFGPE
jgi:hypothetical protein